MATSEASSDERLLLSPPYHFPVRSSADVIAARRKAAEVAEQAGFSSLEQTRVAVVVSLLARDALSFAEHGEITFDRLTNGGFAITAVYQGVATSVGCQTEIKRRLTLLKGVAERIEDAEEGQGSAKTITIQVLLRRPGWL